MSVITLESSRSISNSKSNSEWTSDYANTYLIEDGDVFSMKNAFIDSGKTDEEDIILDEDTPIVLHLGYYVINYTGYKKLKKDGASAWSNIDYKSYVPYFMSSHGGNTKYGNATAIIINQYTNDQDFFSRELLNQFIFEFTAINELGQSIKQKYKPSGIGVYLGASGDLDYPYKFQWNFGADATMIDIEESSILQITPITKDISEWFKINGYVWTNEHQGKAPGAGHPGTMTIGNFTTTVPAGTYSYENLSKYITDKMDSRKTLNGDSKVITNNDFLRRSDEDGDIQFLQVSNGTPDPATGNMPAPILPITSTNDQMYYYSTAFWFGSTQNSLEYNLDNQRDIFSFNYLHTPMKDTQGNQITLDFLLNSKWYSVNKNGGVFIIGAYPESFWQDKLGFDLGTLVVKPEIAANNCQIIRDNMLKDGITTTGQYLNLDGLIKLPTGANLYTTEINITTPNPIQSESTYSINANNMNSKLGSGAYLIEVSGIPQTYMYNQETNPNISGVVSKQYNASSLIVGFSDSSINYQHQGHAFTLQSLKIRILDIATKQPAELGPNSSLIFNIFKNPNPEPDNENKKLKTKN